ncbi:MAG: hypothetical protein IJ760_00185 [Bacteroidales bacterium]|nr:hypothetical protein [Bacteroidales bacterium]
MNLPKIHSVTKKIVVALLGGFLLLFVLFHATANLFILRHDEGAWYSAFCHFMGTNWIVKIFEIVLLGVFLLHILVTLWLVFTNRLARPVRYHHKPGTKTHSTSTLMALTGILIFAFLIMHFCQFYFVKLGWVKGEYMVETAKLQDPQISGIVNMSQQWGLTPEELIDELEQEASMRAEDTGEQDETAQYISELREKMAVMQIVARATEEGNITSDGKWLRHLTYDERQTLRKVMPESKPEPDFYYMCRNLFHNPLMVLLYLITFVALLLHMLHAFPSAFQTLGLANYTYAKAIDIIGKVYAWLIFIMFSAVPVLVYLGL